jgi:hypothetical protein
MVEYVELGGKKRPVLYGSAAFKMLRQKKSLTMMDFLEDIGSGESTYLSDLTYCALRLGERYEKVKEIDEYDEMDVAMWMDISPGGIAGFLERIVSALPKPSAGEGANEPGEALGTGIGTNSNAAQVS